VTKRVKLLFSVCLVVTFVFLYNKDIQIYPGKEYPYCTIRKCKFTDIIRMCKYIDIIRMCKYTDTLHRITVHFNQSALK